MHIFILTLGTRGDFELFLTLGRSLRKRGHHVVLGTSEFYAAKTQEAGIEWAPMGKGSWDETVALLRSLAAVHNRTKRTHLFFKQWLQPQLSASMNRITSIGAGTDYFISNLKMMLQREEGIIPGAAVTYDPPGAIEDLSKYGTQNHNGLILDLVAMTKTLLDPSDLWGAQYQFTGFWHPAQQQDWNPPDELVDYLNRGVPPVVVTMGSMVMFDAEKLVRDIARALHICRQRGIIVGGWSGLSTGDTSSDLLYFVNEVPYDWLFPRASCVIHHGGCGTVAAALRAGKPSIVLPQILSQEHFSRILARESLATGIFDVHPMDHEKFAAAVYRAVVDEQIKHNARNWQRKVLADQGVEAAVDLIEEHWNRICSQSK